MLTRGKPVFLLTPALFAVLALFAWKSGRKVYEVGPELEIREVGDAVVMRWAHDVAAPMAERFQTAFDDWKGRTDHIIIELDSPGGALAEGRLVVDAIEAMRATHLVATRVGSGDECASMCVPIYLAGEERIAARDALFMFHEPSSYDLVTQKRVDKPGFEQRMTSKRFFDRYFAASEMDPQWRENLRVAWKGRDLWFTAEELVEQGSGVVRTLD
ncbi:MAG: ATP-dependent Clp protease proteolytic subunit [Parvularculaceae bacterium]|nr:ATP-dependent Clp protease proteolytic subunit [Parvularculaceae bacterium]